VILLYIYITAFHLICSRIPIIPKNTVDMFLLTNGSKDIHSVLSSHTVLIALTIVLTLCYPMMIRRNCLL